MKARHLVMFRHLLNSSRNSMFYDVLSLAETLFWTGGRGPVPVTLIDSL